MHHPQRHNRTLPIGLVALGVIAAALPVLAVLGWLAWQWRALEQAYPGTAATLRIAVFAAPLILGAAYGVVGLVGAYHRWGSKPAAYADKQIRMKQAEVQVAPLATSFTYHKEGESTPDPLAIAPPITTTLALDDWMAWIDEQPHALLAGKTKAGKTHLATALLERRLKAKETVFIIDPHSSNWLSLPTAGGVTNPKELKYALVAVLAEYNSRMRQRDAYKKQNSGQELPLDYFPRLNVLIDECNAIAAQEATTWAPFATALASGSRKVGIALIILAQSPNVDDIGFSAKMRNNFAAIALDAASVQLLIDGVRDRDRKAALHAAVPASYPAAAQIGPSVWLLDRQLLAMGAAPAGALAQMWDGWDYAAGCAVRRPSGLLGTSTAPAPVPPAAVPLSPTQRVAPVPTTQIVLTVQDRIYDELLARCGQWLTASEIAAQLRLDEHLVRTEIKPLCTANKVERRKIKVKTTRETYEYAVNQSVSQSVNGKP